MHKFINIRAMELEKRQVLQSRFRRGSPACDLQEPVTVEEFKWALVQFLQTGDCQLVQHDDWLLGPFKMLHELFNPWVAKHNDHSSGIPACVLTLQGHQSSRLSK
eukprot:TRINITY_DN9362_c0_g1_i2.p1 TRINITY_DN9362_c0_g1~~TRINITY_DN9362_c0_g1_i2.p1  ORF type:complete len:105 (+),score=5.32 TRINITY_DN9362_c0_g1_i2:172-486(+)